ncbi:hypothetical protein LX64_04063 [Chitinophaga skermanii]|uniref:Uncharacterized protein n=1 Tax=Chitinophaga skermanii TaxID=331697 RepID=A0A327Q7J8_9BACT|nr:DUF6263 family protein [Chitinophaga skermanii]RAJ00360.1 hypothetical protein LX64_04063 [Chitinophaga skermanii]
MKKLLLFLTIISISSIVIAQKKVVLKTTLKEGQRFEYSTDIDQDIHIGNSGQDMNMVIGSDVDIIVGKTGADKTTELLFTYTRMKYLMKMGEEAMGFDSEDSLAIKIDTADMKSVMINSVFKSMFGGMINASFKVYVDAQFKVVKVTGINEMVDKILEGIDFLGEEEKAAMKKGMASGLSDEAMLENLKTMMMQWPSKPVGVNDTFNIKISNPKLALVTTYKVQEIKAPVVKFALNGVAEVTEGHLKGTQTGFAEVDLTTGMTTRSEISQELSNKDEAPSDDFITTIKSKAVVGIKKKK